MTEFLSEFHENTKVRFFMNELLLFPFLHESKASKARKWERERKKRNEDDLRSLMPFKGTPCVDKKKNKKNSADFCAKTKRIELIVVANGDQLSKELSGKRKRESLLPKEIHQNWQISLNLEAFSSSRFALGWRIKWNCIQVNTMWGEKIGNNNISMAQYSWQMK